MKYLILGILIVTLMSPAKQIYAQTIIKNNRGNDRSEINVLSSYPTATISWYARGLRNPKAFTTACWSEYPKGTYFRISYMHHHIIVRCNDRGHFREMGRFLDLSAGAFKSLSPLSTGVIKAKVEVLNERRILLQ